MKRRDIIMTAVPMVATEIRLSARVRALHRDPRSQPSQRNGLAELDTEYPVRVGADVGARIVTEDTLRTQTVLVPALNLLRV